MEADRLFAFAHLPGFEQDRRALGLDDDAVRGIQNLILQNPMIGKVMPGTGGLRKMRYAAPGSGKGKSGSYRVGYVYIVTKSVIVLVTVFAKNEMENLSKADRNALKSVIDRFRD